MRRRVGAALCVASLAMGACGGCDNKGSGASSADAAPVSTPVLSTNSSPASGRAAPPPPKAASTWSGSYKSVAHGFYLPKDAPNAKDWSGVTFQGEDAATGLGEGPLELAVDDATGRVTGSLGGPLGPAVVAGLLKDGAFSATIRRRDPSDQGFTGTADGKANGDKIDGTMHLALGQANVIRSAAFTLDRKR